MDVKEAEEFIKNDKQKREEECLQSLMAILAKYNCQLIVGRYEATRDGRLIPQIAVESK